MNGRSFKRLRTLFFIFTALATISVVKASSESIYLRQVKPILKERCYACHGALKQEAGLRLDTADLIRKGSNVGSILEKRGNDPAELVVRMTTADLSARMPPEGHAVTPEQIAQIQLWIASGAEGPKQETPEADPREHWAFRRIERPPIPTNAFIDGNRNPIDAFIAASLDAHGLVPQPVAGPEQRLRRLYLDLIGLPPSRDDLHQFLGDPSQSNWEAAVDRLLSSPQYGERWGRHWMDVWRYSDWYGRRMVPDVWNSAPQIWRWRDWIVRSLNQDVGYDHMISCMLAGDEFAPDDDEAGYATGYLIRNWYALNPNDWMRNNVEHAGKAFLGLTFNCAHCHDHKYDPITQDNYFQFRAFFEPIGIRQDRVPGEADPGPFQEYEYSVLRKIVRIGSVRVYDRNPGAATWFYTGGDERNRVADRGSMSPGVPLFLIPQHLQIGEIQLPIPAVYPGLRPAMNAALLAEYSAAIAAVDQKIQQCQAQSEQQTAKFKALNAERAAIGAARSAYEARFAADFAKYNGSPGADPVQLAEAASRIERNASVLQAEALVATREVGLEELKAIQNPDAETQKKIAAADQDLTTARTAVTEAMARLHDSALAGKYTPTGPEYAKSSTGRRRALVQWMTHRDHPLTSRVAVNHIWMRHFHSPLVASVFDFGRNGTPPTHPELLDWLAVELVESGWSMKHIHRLIVTSRVWQSSSSMGASSVNLEHDPDNRFLWRMNSGRMESEVLRDSLLFTAGRLDLTMGGQELENSQAMTTFRRSVYYSCNPELDGKNPLGALFDAPEPADCYRRSRSVVPQQALALFNSELIHQMSNVIAERLISSAEQAHPSAQQLLPEQQFAKQNHIVVAAFEQILSRTPSPDELRICTESIAGGMAVDSLVRVLLNHNDFVAVR
ncbi:MAG: PSD1 domain-containing protein [Planctomyces sp.]|nr:PSD1 domain-containing protein [Planctomyces sp.]